MSDLYIAQAEEEIMRDPSNATAHLILADALRDAGQEEEAQLHEDIGRSLQRIAAIKADNKDASENVEV